MARYKSIVAYDGTDFRGFQRQAGGVATVQATLEAALSAIGWHGESLLAAGRTDAGVHAAGQVVAFDLEWKHSSDALAAALNANLPVEIAVVDAQRVEADFHPRFWASSRTYRYHLYLAPHRDPLRHRYSWRRWPGPKLEPMNDLAGNLLGRNDFGAFGQAPIEGGHTERTLLSACWEAMSDEVVFEVRADAFLQHMVRRLVDALVAVGEGMVEPAQVLGLMNRPDLRWERGLAPAKGLVLASVEYANVESLNLERGASSPHAGN